MASKSKRKAVSFKFTKELLFLILFIVVILIATIILAIPSSQARNLSGLNAAISEYNQKNSTNYNTLGDDNCFFLIENDNYEELIDDVMEKANEEGYTMFFYGSLTNAVFLENLSIIDNYASEYKENDDAKKITVYLFLNDYVSNAADNDETETLTYKKTIDEYNEKFNKTIESGVEKFDLTKFPTLLVYNKGKLVFNSQVGDNASQYKYPSYITKAFSFFVSEFAENK